MTAEQHEPGLMDRKFSRRDLFKGAAALGTVAALGIEVTHPQDALAGAGETAPWIPVERYDMVRNIKTADFSVDPELVKRKITPILYMQYNFYQDEFADIPHAPNNPRDMLDTAFLKLSAGLHHNMKDIEALPDRNVNAAEFADSVYKKREDNNFEIPSEGSFSSYVDLVKKGTGKVKIWATDDSADPNFGLKLTEYDPKKGLSVKLMQDNPVNVTQVDGNSGKPFSGFTVKVNDGQLEIGLFMEDQSFTEESAYYTTGKNMDLDYTYALYDAFENLMMYGGRTDLQNVIDANYETKREDNNGVLYPDLGSLLMGPLSTKTIPGRSVEGYYDTSPVLLVTSKAIPRKDGER